MDTEAPEDLIRRLSKHERVGAVEGMQPTWGAVVALYGALSECVVKIREQGLDPPEHARVVYEGWHTMMTGPQGSVSTNG